MLKKKGRTISGLISCILDDDICLVVLEVSQRQEHDISLVDPDLERQSQTAPRDHGTYTYLLSHLTANMG